jgi:hypothetical protein
MVAFWLLSVVMTIYIGFFMRHANHTVVPRD